MSSKLFKEIGNYEIAYKYSKDLLNLKDSLENLTLKNLENLTLLEKTENEKKIIEQKIIQQTIKNEAGEKQSRMWALIFVQTT